MKITGKAKVDFIKYFWNKVDFELEENSIDEYLMIFESNYEVTHQQASVVEWLDSVGYHINFYSQTNCLGTAFNFNILGVYEFYNYDYYTKRIIATQQAINKAIEIYNNR